MEASIVVGKLLEQKSNTYGFDAQTEKYVDFIEAGIVDPTKVVRIALQNAASVAALLITTEAMIADRPKKEAGARRRRHAAAAAWAAWAIWTSKSRHGRPASVSEARAGHPSSKVRKARWQHRGFFFSIGDQTAKRCLHRFRIFRR